MKKPKVGDIDVRSGVPRIYRGVPRGYVPIKAAMDRLKEYEDTGASPEWVRGVIRTEQRARWESACIVQQYEIDNAKQGNAPDRVIKQMEDNLARLEEQKEKALGEINAAEKKKESHISDDKYKTSEDSLRNALASIEVTIQDAECCAWSEEHIRGLRVASFVIGEKLDSVRDAKKGAGE